MKFVKPSCFCPTLYITLDQDVQILYCNSFKLGDFSLKYKILLRKYFEFNMLVRSLVKYFRDQEITPNVHTSRKCCKFSVCTKRSNFLHALLLHRSTNFNNAILHGKPFLLATFITLAHLFHWKIKTLLPPATTVIHSNRNHLEYHDFSFI